MIIEYRIAMGNTGFGILRDLTLSGRICWISECWFFIGPAVGLGRILVLESHRIPTLRIQLSILNRDSGNFLIGTWHNPMGFYRNPGENR
jgi:hypothetical protein